MKRRVKTGDEVVVISGASRGDRGKILQTNRQTQRVLIEGVNKVKRHEKRKSEEIPGGIIDREAPIHISNVMLAERYDARRGHRPDSAETDSAETDSEDEE